MAVCTQTLVTGAGLYTTLPMINWIEQRFDLLVLVLVLVLVQVVLVLVQVLVLVLVLVLV